MEKDVTSLNSQPHSLAQPASSNRSVHGPRVNSSLLVYKAFSASFWGCLGCSFPYVFLYLKQLGFSPNDIGTVSALRPFIGFIFIPFIAAAADRFRCRKLVLRLCLVIGAGIFCSLAVLPPAHEVPCDVMERQIREIVHLNISLPYPYQGEQKPPLPPKMFTSELHMRRRRNQPDTPAVDFPMLPSTIVVDGEVIRSSLPIPDNTTIGVSEQFPWQVREILFANQRWLYDQTSIMKLFLFVFLITSVIEVAVFSATCQSDIATLDALRQEHGNVDQYGWNRVFGTLGWGSCSLAVGLILGSTRTVKVSCGIQHVMTAYWTAFVISAVLCVVALFCTFYFKPSSYEYDDEKSSEGSSWDCIKAVLLSWHYGSVVVTVTFLGLCNGCIWGFLFWHLENLGATQVLIGVLTGIESLSEFMCGFLSGWGISKFGHIPLLTLGLFLYAIRFVFYALIVAPWMAIFTEIVHGLGFITSWTTIVSYLNDSLPPQFSGTMQGIVTAVHHGLGAGAGFLLTGFLITGYGAKNTFFIYAIMCSVVLVIFMLIQWLYKAPSFPWTCQVEKQHALLQGDGVPDDEKLKSPKFHESSPDERKDNKFSLKLPPFTYQTQTIHQQQPS